MFCTEGNWRFNNAGVGGPGRVVLVPAVSALEESLEGESNRLLFGGGGETSPALKGSYSFATIGTSGASTKDTFELCEKTQTGRVHSCRRGQGVLRHRPIEENIAEDQGKEVDSSLAVVG